MDRTRPGRAALACGLLACLSLGAPAEAQEGVAVKNILGNIGIIPREREAIPYRERAPLVIPPKTELRQPTASTAAADPQWPNDPDVAARRRKSDEDRKPVTWSETRRMSERDARLSPDELRQGRTASNPNAVPGSHRGDNARDVLMTNPNGPRGETKKDDKTAEVEPGRKVLTDPPSGMRRSAMGGPVKTDFAPRVDRERSDADPLTWIRKQFNKGDEDE